MKYGKYQVVIVDLDSLNDTNIRSISDLTALKERNENLFFIYSKNSARKYYSGATYMPKPVVINYDINDNNILGIAPNNEYECIYLDGTKYYSCFCKVENGFIAGVWDDDANGWISPNDLFITDYIVAIKQIGTPKRLEIPKIKKAAKIDVQAGNLELEEAIGDTSFCADDFEVGQVFSTKGVRSAKKYYINNNIKNKRKSIAMFSPTPNTGASYLSIHPYPEFYLWKRTQFANTICTDTGIAKVRIATEYTSNNTGRKDATKIEIAEKPIINGIIQDMPSDAVVFDILEIIADESVVAKQPQPKKKKQAAKFDISSGNLELDERLFYEV